MVTPVEGSPWKTRDWLRYYDEFNPAADAAYLTASTGMWHQLGSSLKNSYKGYYLRVEDIGDHGLATAVGFLEPPVTTAALLGQPTTIGHAEKPMRSKKSLSVKLGKLASEKEIKEAVVAIPYFLDDACGVNFFDLDPYLHEAAKQLVEDRKDKAIEKMLKSQNPN